MNDKNYLTKMDKTVVQVISLKDNDKMNDREYWMSKSPEERWEALELLRQRFYQYDPIADRLQRVIEVVKLK